MSEGAVLSTDPRVPQDFVDKCEQWRAFMNTVIGANMQMAYDQGCDCGTCTNAKNAGFAASFLYHAVMLTLSGVKAADMEATKAVTRQQLEAYMDSFLAQQVTNAPTTQTPQ